MIMEPGETRSAAGYPVDLGQSWPMGEGKWDVDEQPSMRRAFQPRLPNLVRLVPFFFFFAWALRGRQPMKIQC